jgi:hypothetical protein
MTYIFIGMHHYIYIYIYIYKHELKFAEHLLGNTAVWLIEVCFCFVTVHACYFCVPILTGLRHEA